MHKFVGVLDKYVHFATSRLFSFVLFLEAPLKMLQPALLKI